MFDPSSDTVIRPYTPEDVTRLAGRTRVEHTLATLGAQRLRRLIAKRAARALGASTGNMAVQQVRAGLEAVYCSGWQVAADANTAGQTYPDQSLYPVDSVPSLVKRINSALLRAEQVDAVEGCHDTDWMVPIVADAEAGFGGPLNVHELTKALIEAGAAGIHLEDQLASAKKCGHLGGKVLVPTSHFVQSLVAARLAADVMGVPTVIIARTDALSAQLITSDIDERDRQYLSKELHPIDGSVEFERTSEGFYRLTGDPMARTLARGLAYAPYADMLWFETSTPDLEEARAFAEAIHVRFPNKPLAYNCSPSFNWRKHLSNTQIASFQDDLASLGYRFQFVTLAGFHALSHSMYTLARGYRLHGMEAYVDLQEEEKHAERLGYTATKHQREVGTGYFDAVSQVISSGKSSTLAMAGSTEADQFEKH